MTSPCSLLEVGSGSGQHAVCFATALPHVAWQPTDQGDYYPGLVDNISRLAPENVLPPRYLDLTAPEWPDMVDCLFSANVIHIMPAALLPKMFASPANRLMFYGPFKYDSEFTSDSNANFDLWLKDRNPLSGVRDIEALVALAEKTGYELKNDTPMPANNQFLLFER